MCLQKGSLFTLCTTTSINTTDHHQLLFIKFSYQLKSTHVIFRIWSGFTCLLFRPQLSLSYQVEWKRRNWCRWTWFPSDTVDSCKNTIQYAETQTRSNVVNNVSIVLVPFSSYQGSYSFMMTVCFLSETPESRTNNWCKRTLFDLLNTFIIFSFFLWFMQSSSVSRPASVFYVDDEMLMSPLEKSKISLLLWWQSVN